MLAAGAGLVWFGHQPSQLGPTLPAVAASTTHQEQAPRAASPTPPSGAPPSTSPPTCPDAPGDPVSITVPGMHAQAAPVESHPLGMTDEGRFYPDALYVPPDPRKVSWLNYPDVGPGADHGTAVFISHVNYAHVLGAFADLTAYSPGQRITVVLADGRALNYHVVPAATMGFPATGAALVVKKTQLDADPSISRQIYDFDRAWSTDGAPACGRLVLVTCSGTVINGNYQDNAFVFALPDRTHP